GPTTSKYKIYGRSPPHAPPRAIPGGPRVEHVPFSVFTRLHAPAKEEDETHHVPRRTPCHVSHLDPATCIVLPRYPSDVT
ncbi:hypothetical protein A2U01_0048085, partial [Trifolium medium]|nr:hypothetical protein [Trifolium medium]